MDFDSKEALLNFVQLFSLFFFSFSKFSWSSYFLFFRPIYQQVVLQNKKISMKTNKKNSLKSKSVNCRIVEIHELIEQIRILLSEIEDSNEINSIRYLIGAEMNVVTI